MDARLAYVENEILQADPIRLVQMLYRGALLATGKARVHLREGDIPARSRQITKASEIINELTLSLDHQRGGELARNLVLSAEHRHAGVNCMDQDVFVNAVGGVRINEPAADLAVLLAIQGSLRGKPLPRGFIAFGEVGLAGEVRPAPRGQERLKEAAKLGFSVAVVPKANAPKKAIEGLTIHAVERIEQAIEVVRGMT